MASRGNQTVTVGLIRRIQQVTTWAACDRHGMERIRATTTRLVVFARCGRAETGAGTGACGAVASHPSPTRASQNSRVSDNELWSAPSIIHSVATPGRNACRSLRVSAVGTSSSAAAAMINVGHSTRAAYLHDS